MLPLTRRRNLAGAAILALLILIFFLARGGDEPEEVVAADPVHPMCTPGDEVTAAHDAAPGQPSIGRVGDTEPISFEPRMPAAATGDEQAGPELFFQNDNRWTATEYAFSTRLPAGTDWCGTTIGQCGCAATSLTNVLSMFQIVSTPDAPELTPETLNAWLNRNARETDEGWISDGYFLGNVVWTDVQAFTAMLRRDNPEVPLLRFRGFGSGTPEELRRELSGSNAAPVVLAVGGTQTSHFIAAVGLSGDRIRIHDPFYRDRVWLDEYPGNVFGSRLFEPTTDASAIMVAASPGMRVVLRDSTGTAIGSHDQTAAHLLAEEVNPGGDGWQYVFEGSWRDPTCTERAPEPGAGNTMVFLPAPDGDVEADVRGSGCVTIYRYDAEGNVTVTMRCYGEDSSELLVSTPDTTERPGGPPPEDDQTITTTVEIDNENGGDATINDVRVVINGEEVAPNSVTSLPPGEYLVRPAAALSGYQLQFQGDCAPSGALSLAVGQQAECLLSYTFPPAEAQPPTVAVGCSPDPVAVGDRVNCFATLSDGAADSVVWTTSDGQRLEGEATQTAFSPAFSSPGARTISALVCNEEGCDEASDSVTVMDSPRVVLLTCSPPTVAAGELTECRVVLAGGPASTIGWTTSAGLGASGDGDFVTFGTVFLGAGARTVTVTACNLAGCDSDETSLGGGELTRIDSLSCEPGAPAAGQEITCSVLTSGPEPSGITWDDGTTSTTQTGSGASTFTTSFDAPGTHTVSVSVCNDAGCRDDSLVVSVGDALPPPEVNCSPRQLFPTQQTFCEATVPAAADSVTWFTSTGESLSGTRGLTTYTAAFDDSGTHTVSLEACDGEICSTGSTTVQVGTQAGSFTMAATTVPLFGSNTAIAYDPHIAPSSRVSFSVAGPAGISCTEGGSIIVTDQDGCDSDRRPKFVAVSLFSFGAGNVTVTARVMGDTDNALGTPNGFDGEGDDSDVLFASYQVLAPPVVESVFCTQTLSGSFYTGTCTVTYTGVATTFDWSISPGTGAGGSFVPNGATATYSVPACSDVYFVSVFISGPGGSDSGGSGSDIIDTFIGDCPGVG